MTGRVEALWVKRAHGSVMDRKPAIELVTNRGVAGSADQRTRRQVTVIDADRWEAICRSLGAQIDPSTRRANVMLRGVDLRNSRGRLLKIGSTVVRLLGETRPCNLMDESFSGLREAMKPEWGGGAYGEIVEGGEIRVGDEARLEGGT